jgi:hypothetical protein
MYIDHPCDEYTERRLTDSTAHGKARLGRRGLAAHRHLDLPHPAAGISISSDSVSSDDINSSSDDISSDDTTAAGIWHQ